jgi:hypothetical protein
VVAGEPTPERGVSVTSTLGGDLVGLWHVDGELEEHPIRVLGVERTAVAVLEDVGALGFQAAAVRRRSSSAWPSASTLRAMCRNGDGKSAGSNNAWSAGSANWKKASALPSARPKNVWQ